MGMKLALGVVVEELKDGSLLYTHGVRVGDEINQVSPDTHDTHMMSHDHHMTYTVLHKIFILMSIILFYALLHVCSLIEYHLIVT